MEQDGYVYNFAYELSTDENSSISVIDAKTRERIKQKIMAIKVMNMLKE